jgi:hypothetical protein
MCDESAENKVEWETGGSFYCAGATTAQQKKKTDNC